MNKLSIAKNIENCFVFVCFCIFVYLGVQKKSNTGKKKHMQVWVPNTVTI